MHKYKNLKKNQAVKLAFKIPTAMTFVMFKLIIAFR